MDKTKGRKIFKVIKDTLMPEKNIKIKMSDILEDTLKYYHGAWVKWIVNNDEIKATIEIYTGLYDYHLNSEFKQNDQWRYGIFLKNIELEITDETLFVMTVLHEMGHVHYNQLLFDNDCFSDYMTLQNIAMSNLKLGFDKEKTDYYLNEVGMAPYNLFCFQEVLADKYAIENFIPIWKLLKEKKLV